MIIHRDVVYAEYENYDPHLTSMDIYKPAELASPAPDKPLLPVIIYIHGGALKIGDKRGVHHKPAFFTQQNYIFISINYRLSPGQPSAPVRHPMHIQDTAAAIAHIYSMIRQHHGNPDRLFIVGHSAGAYLAALIATNPSYLAEHDLPLDILKGVIPIDTAKYDLLPIRRFALLVPDKSWLVQALGQDLLTWQDASPAFHINKQTESNPIPPFLLLYCNSRRDASRAATNFAKRLNKYNHFATAVGYDDKTHLTINRQLGLPHDPPTETIMQFLNERISQLDQDELDHSAE
ncbi:alpha/beta hydrolase [Poriferisphaera sp. WC338]|uniref:alpha/beta hydrolase n=1 Tax=Poriferisphaera sp. WC338 TaxID=3425129 RepID=UPI003D814034